jgi:hypothetical protein
MASDRSGLKPGPSLGRQAADRRDHPGGCLVVAVQKLHPGLADVVVSSSSSSSRAIYSIVKRCLLLSARSKQVSSLHVGTRRHCNHHRFECTLKYVKGNRIVSDLIQAKSNNQHREVWIRLDRFC